MVKEKMAKIRAIREEYRSMKRELDILKGKVGRGVLEDSKGKEEWIERREPRKDRETMPID